MILVSSNFPGNVGQVENSGLAQVAQEAEQ